MKATKKRNAPGARKPLTVQQAFLAASAKGDLREQVRIARERLHGLIWLQGIDDEILPEVATLAGDWKPAKDA